MIDQFSVISWNVRGLGDSSKCGVIKQFMRNIKCNFLCMPETKLNTHSPFTLRFICDSSFQEVCYLDATGRSGGILSTWKNRLTHTTILSLAHSIIVMIKF